MVNFTQWRTCPHYLFRPNRIMRFFTSNQQLFPFLWRNGHTAWKAAIPGWDSWQRLNRPNDKLGVVETLGLFCSKSSSNQEGSPPSQMDCHKTPDLASSNGDNLTFGQLLQTSNLSWEIFSQISAFETYSEHNAVYLDKTKHWFKIDVLGISDLETHAGLTSPLRRLTKKNLQELLAESNNISYIWTLAPADNRSSELIATTRHPMSLQLQEAMKTSSLSKGIFYKSNQVKVPESEMIRAQILKSKNNNKLAGNPGQVKTMLVVGHSFRWPSITAYMHRYFDSCEYCQRVKAVTRKPLGTLNPLSIPGG